MDIQNRWRNVTSGLESLEIIKQIFDDHPEGVMILDVHTVLVYYNKAQGKIDDLDPDQALGKTVLELYRVSDNTSYPTMRCLFSRKPLIDYTCFYYTHLGKLVNSIHNVFPILADDGQLTGCICFIRDYGKISKQFNVAAANSNASLCTPEAADSKHAKYTFSQIITQDPSMQKSVEMASRAANSPSPVMLYGETGCGKEMFAQAIHNVSSRHNNQFMPINCAAIPESLLEGIIFGTVKGAFTGAADRPGIMELADQGTLFFDEINSMPYGLQTKLLRAVQEQKVRRVGGSKEKSVSLKIISATNVNPQKAITDGTLRADLFFRLGVVLINIPPLRQRSGDIILLTTYFIKKLNQRLGKSIIRLSPQVENIFLHHQWPGNVRELEHVLEGAMNQISNDANYLEPEHFSASLIGNDLNPISTTALLPNGSLSSINSLDVNKYPTTDSTQNEVAILVEALKAATGNAAKAARSLGISPQLMNYKMKKYDLKKKIKVDIL